MPMMKSRNLGWRPALSLRWAAMGLLTVRNASEPSFTSGSIALLPDTACSSSLLRPCSPRGRRGVLHSYEGTGRGRGCAAAEVVARRASFLLGEEGEGGKGSQKRGVGIVSSRASASGWYWPRRSLRTLYLSGNSFSTPLMT